MKNRFSLWNVFAVLGGLALAAFLSLANGVGFQVSLFELLALTGVGLVLDIQAWHGKRLKALEKTTGITVAQQLYKYQR